MELPISTEVAHLSLPDFFSEFEDAIDGRQSVSMHGLIDPDTHVHNADTVTVEESNSDSPIQTVVVDVDDDDVVGYLIKTETATGFLTTASLDSAREATKQFEKQPSVGRLSVSGIRLIDILQSPRFDDREVRSFTGYRPPLDDANKKQRNMSYWGEDAGKTLEKMSESFSIRPSSVRTTDGESMYDVKCDGVVVPGSNALSEAWELIEALSESVGSVVDSIRKGGPEEAETQFGMTHEIIIPWRISPPIPLDKEIVGVIESLLDSGRWETGISTFRHNSGGSFDSEVIDTERYSRTKVRGYGDRLRVYPHDELGIGTQLRIHACVEDSLEAICETGEVQDRTKE